MLALVALSGCGLTRPPDPAPFDCETIDRAEERFPDRCGQPEEDAGVDAGSEVEP
ncbi:MAG: hypothetical protein M5U28_25000 [Sandaracinaceae bacterium]|nr:hypothetical protein [Sandaracinaceae bacterium]